MTIFSVQVTGAMTHPHIARCQFYTGCDFFKVYLFILREGWDEMAGEGQRERERGRENPNQGPH